jgi:hypothetical protein
MPRAAPFQAGGIYQFDRPGGWVEDYNKAICSVSQLLSHSLYL